MIDLIFKEDIKEIRVFLNFSSETSGMKYIRKILLRNFKLKSFFLI